MIAFISTHMGLWQALGTSIGLWLVWCAGVALVFRWHGRATGSSTINGGPKVDR